MLQLWQAVKGMDTRCVGHPVVRVRRADHSSNKAHEAVRKLGRELGGLLNIEYHVMYYRKSI